MSKVRFTLNALAVVIFTLTVSSMAHAQATRTWVSGVGDDANPCSRTAPCKTFAGAISKTAAGGEINAIDPGGFGAVNITKAITIDGGATFASILASGTTGVIVNAGAADVVTLRNLSINGATLGLNGVRILAGKTVLIENCQIFKFRTGNGRAISEERTQADAELYVTNTTMNDNSGNAVVINFTQAGASTEAVFNNVRIFDNTVSGIFAGSGAKVTIRDSAITGNGNAGVQSADANTEMYIVDTAISHNTNHGIVVGASTTVRISNVTIGENGSGVTNNGTLESFGNNNVRGNNSNNIAGTNVGQL